MLLRRLRQKSGATRERVSLLRKVYAKRAAIRGQQQPLPRADAKVCGLLNDAICINALLLWRIDKIKSENQLLRKSEAAKKARRSRRHQTKWQRRPTSYES